MTHYHGNQQCFSWQIKCLSNTALKNRKLKTLFPQIRPKTVLSAFEKWKIMHNSCSIILVIFPYTKSEENANFLLWAAICLQIWITHLFSVCLCQHRHVLTSDQSWTLQVSWYLLGLYWRSGKQGSGLCWSHPCSTHLSSMQYILYM